MNLPHDVLYPLRVVSAAEIRIRDVLGVRLQVERAWYISDDGERLTCGALWHDQWASARTGIADGRAAHGVLRQQGYIPLSEPIEPDWAWNIHVDGCASLAARAELREWMYEHFEDNEDYPILLNGVPVYSFPEFAAELPPAEEAPDGTDA